MKMNSMSVVIWKMQIVATMRRFTIFKLYINHYATTRQDKVKKSEVIKFEEYFE